MKDGPSAPGACFWTSGAFDSSAPTKSKTNKRNSWQHRTRGELPEKQVGTRSNNHREEDELHADGRRWWRCVMLVWHHKYVVCCFWRLSGAPPYKWRNTSFKPFGLEFLLNFIQNLFHEALCLYRLEGFFFDSPHQKNPKNNQISTRQKW